MLIERWIEPRISIAARSKESCRITVRRYAPEESSTLFGTKVSIQQIIGKIRTASLHAPLFLKAALVTAAVFSVSAVSIANADEVDELLDDLVRYREKTRAAAESAMVVAEPVQSPAKAALNRPELRQEPRAQLRSRRIRAGLDNRAVRTKHDGRNSPATAR